MLNMPEINARNVKDIESIYIYKVCDMYIKYNENPIPAIANTENNITISILRLKFLSGFFNIYSPL